MNDKRWLLRAFRALTVVAAVAGIGAPARAQLDPRVVEQIQGQLGSSAGRSPSDLLDQSRGVSGAEAGADVEDIRAPQATAEELAVRRQRSRQQLEALEPTSPIEAEYQRRTGDGTLRQFGYNLFAAAAPPQTAVTGALGSNYVLGIGDELVITFQGAVNRGQTARVNREGRLIVGELPPIQAAGRSLGAVRAELQAATRRTMLGTSIDVSVGSVRAISVFVGGEVNRPGQYQLTSLSDITAALAQAGGVRKSGSLRRARLIRSGTTRTVDLYGLLGLGTPPATRMQDGDRIIIPVIGDTIAVAGGVARPGIYEVRGATTAGQALALAGGTVRPRGQDVSISRIGRGGQEEFLRTSSGTQVLPGDALQVIGGAPGGAAGRVLLLGYVQNPGSRPLALAPTVKALLGSASELQVDTYLPAAVRVTRDLRTGARRYEVIDLGLALSGQRDVPLSSEDRVFILNRDDVAFINNPAVRNIVLGQPSPVGCRGLARLEELVRDTQSQRYAAVTRGTYQTTGGSVATVARALSDRTGMPAQQQVRDAGFGAVGGRSAGGRPLDVASDDSACPAVFSQEPELLPVLIENSVTVGGAIRRPGAYPVAGPVSAATLSTIAEGLLGDAADLTLDITRATGGPTSQERLASPGGAQVPAVVLRPGDDVRFNASLSQFETGGVLVSGEVSRPGLYVIRRGEKLSDLLQRAGGLTTLSYPYGAIFTRNSVRVQQREGNQRTARELNEALLAISARRPQSSGEALQGSMAFVSSLANTEPVGRVVVEADPRVLALRPDLDITLEAGDSLFVPKQPTYVLVLGDVSNPGAVQFVAGKTASQYVSETGGLRKSADDDRVFLVLPNGASQPIEMRWGRLAAIKPPPGSTIVVPKNIDPLYGLDVARDVATIVGQFITSVATVALLATQ